MKNNAVIYENGKYHFYGYAPLMNQSLNDMIDSREWLAPDDSHNSFYRKAEVIHLKGGMKLLKSYDTIVMACIDDKYFNTWSEDSTNMTATTNRHIKAFSGLNKKEFYQLPFMEGLNQ